CLARVSCSRTARALASPSSADRALEVWLLATCSSRLITADFSGRRGPAPAKVGIKVGSGWVVHSTHRGKVKMDVDVGGSVVPVTLSNVLYIPEWKECGLVSWPELEKTGKVRLAGQNVILEVRMLDTDRIVIRA